MRARRFIIAAAACVAVAFGAQAVASAHGGGSKPDRLPPALHEPVLSMPRDLGLGEGLLVVTAGTFATQSEAEAADAAFAFGEVQGFYAVPIAQFEGLAEILGTPDPWVLASAFRTSEGAQAFAELATVAGAQPQISALRVRSLGGEYAGLGQESDPSGSGPLTRATRASRPVAP